MIKTTALGLVFIGALLSGSSTFVTPPESEGDLQSREWENFLLKAKVISVRKEIVGGRTGPWLVGLSDGKISCRAIFKHICRPRPALLPDSYQYELAAYELDKLLGFNLVPPVVEREIEGRKGSLQIYLENCITERERRRLRLEPPDPESFQRSLNELRIFENLVFNKCGNTEDTYIHRMTWKVCRVDFSEAFSPSRDLLSGCGFGAASEKILDNLRKLDLKTVEARLSPYLNADEIKGLMERRDRIVGKLEILQR